MNLFSRLTLSVALLGAALSLSSHQASAAPLSAGVNQAVFDGAALPVTKAAYVCGPYRCFHRPAYFAPRPFYGRPHYGSAYFYGRPRHFYGHHNFHRPHYGW